MGDGRCSKHPETTPLPTRTAGAFFFAEHQVSIKADIGTVLCHCFIMWDSFLPDLVVALFGAVLTVAIAVATYGVKIRLDEKRAIQSLINELHRRRALRPAVEGMVAGATDSDDFVRVTSSITSIRDEIRRTRDRVRQVDRLQDPLSEMTRACNRYLTLSAARPDAYVIYVGDLRRTLTSSIQELARRQGGVVALEPGVGTV